MRNKTQNQKLKQGPKKIKEKEKGAKQGPTHPSFLEGHLDFVNRPARIATITKFSYINFEKDF